MKNGSLSRNLFIFAVAGFLTIPPLAFAEAAKQEWTLLSPVGEFGGEIVKLAPRPSDLSGKTICLLDNQKPNANVVVARVEELLKARFKDEKFFSWRKKVANEPASHDEFVKKKCDLIINAHSD